MVFKFKKNLNIIVFFVVGIIGVVIAFSLGFYLGEFQRIEGIINLDKGQPEEVDFSLFWDVWRILEKEFPKPLNPQEMIYGAISGMLEKLDDAYTVFLDPERAKIFKQDIAGEFEGVGMMIGIKNGQLQVIAPIKTTPADRAGLRSGDKIIKIDDIYTENMIVEEAVKFIRGPRGTEVILTILREGWEEPNEIKIIRDVIKIPSLSWELKENNIAYLKIYHFTERAVSEFNVIAEEILNSPAQAIILDLRNNPGGYLEIAQNIAGWFLKRGDIVVIEDFGEEKQQKKHTANGNEKLLKYPLVIIINQGTSSGAEILAGALRDNRQVLLIGETSFGKGSVQAMHNLRQGSVLKVTISNWLTPKKELITNRGLEPDIVVKMTEQDFDQNRDPQLDKAIEIIKEIVRK